eukprot:8954527-Ditylum_brightwellii.AAC.2
MEEKEATYVYICVLSEPHYQLLGDPEIPYHAIGSTLKYLFSWAVYQQIFAMLRRLCATEYNIFGNLQEWESLATECS